MIIMALKVIFFPLFSYFRKIMFISVFVLVFKLKFLSETYTVYSIYQMFSLLDRFRPKVMPQLIKKEIYFRLLE